MLLVSLYGTKSIAVSSILSILGFCGAAYTIGRIARDAGKRIQDDLFSKWGGAPTTQILRHQDTFIDVHTKESCHAVISKGLGKNLPTKEMEIANPKAADELYRAATVWLINQTRDTKVHPLVFKENIAFGFHRNALGIRPVGITVSILCIVWVLLYAQVLKIVPPYMSGENLLDLTPPILTTLGVSILLLFTWTFWLTEDALKRAGFSYAERLLQSYDKIKTTAPKAPKKATPKIAGE